VSTAHSAPGEHHVFWIKHFAHILCVEHIIGAHSLSTKGRVGQTVDVVADFVGQVAAFGVSRLQLVEVVDQRDWVPALRRWRHLRIGHLLRRRLPVLTRSVRHAWQVRGIFGGAGFHGLGSGVSLARSHGELPQIVVDSLDLAVSLRENVDARGVLVVTLLDLWQF